MQDKRYFSLPIEIVEKEAYSFDDSLIPVDIKVMHDGLNLNNSTFDKEAIALAQNSLKNKPILGYIKKGDGENSQDFAGHEVEIGITDDGVKYTYLERPLGVVPEQNNYSILEEDGVEYVFCRGFLWKEYLNDGYSILKDNPNKSVSMEIAVDDYGMNDDGSINIVKYRYLGITILGDDMPPAMVGAEMNVVGLFSEENKDLFTKIETLNNQIASHFSANEEAKDSFKGGEKMGIDNKEAVEIAKGAEGVTPADVKKTADTTVDTTVKTTEGSTEDVNVTTTEPVIDKPKEVGLEEELKVEKTAGEIKDSNIEPERIEAERAKAKEAEKEEDKEEDEKPEDEKPKEDEPKEDKPEEDYKAKYEELLAKFEGLEEEVSGLRDFKSQADEAAKAKELEEARQEKIDYINENYPTIDESVKDQFIDKVDNYDSVEAIDADICVYIVKNQVKFSQAKKTEKSVAKVAVDENQVVESGESKYGNLFAGK